MTKITPNFTLQEFNTRNAPLSLSTQRSIEYLAHRLQVLRDLIGAPITIESGYRSPSHNKEVGGSDDSYHLTGMAADIPIECIPLQMREKLWGTWSGGMGVYPKHVHLDIGPKRRWRGTY